MRVCEILHISTNKVFSSNTEIKDGTEEYISFQAMSEQQLNVKYSFIREHEQRNPDPIKDLEKCIVEAEIINDEISFFIQTSHGRFKLKPESYEKQEQAIEPARPAKK